MDKLLLEKYIKVAAKKALAEQEEIHSKNEKSVYLIYKFPGLKKAMEDFMSPAFSRYIANVTVVSPKPTTLNISLINGQSFQMYYSGQENFVAKIAGRKYNTSEISDIERASKAITNLLLLNYAPPEDENDKKSRKDNDIKKDLESGGGNSGPGQFPGEQGPDNPSDITDKDLEDTTTNDNPPPSDTASTETESNSKEGETEDINV